MKFVFPCIDLDNIFTIGLFFFYFTLFHKMFNSVSSYSRYEVCICTRKMTSRLAPCPWKTALYKNAGICARNSVISKELEMPLTSLTGNIPYFILTMINLRRNIMKFTYHIRIEDPCKVRIGWDHIQIWDPLQTCSNKLSIVSWSPISC